MKSRTHFTTLLLVLFAFSFACSWCSPADLDIGDPREGQLGKVKFTGGGGCNGSTTLALGSTARLTVEPLGQETLPDDLEPRSSAPDVISAQGGSTPEEVVLEALSEGSSTVELLSQQQVYDYLEFSVAPAYSTAYTIAGEVFEGGHLVVKVDEIYGECGEECPLIGGDFIQWTGEPAGQLKPVSTGFREALFLASGTGDASIVGTEPSAGRILLRHDVTILPADSAGTIRCQSTISYLGNDPITADQCPLSVRVGALMLLELKKELPDGSLVPIAGADVTWTLGGDSDVVEPWTDSEGQSVPEGHVFMATNPGHVTFDARVEITGDTYEFTLTVTE